MQQAAEQTAWGGSYIRLGSLELNIDAPYTHLAHRVHMVGIEPKAGPSNFCDTGHTHMKVN